MLCFAVARRGNATGSRGSMSKRRLTRDEVRGKPVRLEGPVESYTMPSDKWRLGSKGRLGDASPGR